MDVVRDLPPSVLGGLAALVVLQLGLQITALVQLHGTETARLSLNGRRWLWVVIIAAGEILGALLWFFMGRVDAADESEPLAADASGRIEHEIDRLYPKD